uniref:CDK14 n=1 Tax=Naja naja TaxID=35670 RepID=A0A8C6YEG1_NAJNA
MSTRNCQGMDSVIKPLDTIPEDKKVRVQRTQSTFDPFEKPNNQVKRVHSENNACINFKSSSAEKESPKIRRHSSPSSVSPDICQGRRQWHFQNFIKKSPELLRCQRSVEI